MAILSGAPLWAQTACPVGIGPSLDSASRTPVECYLARAVAMNGLTDELLPAPYAWNIATDNTPCYRGGPPNDPASYVDSLMCRGLCNFAFCPANFEADVRLLVQLNASFVQFAAGNWDRPDQFVPGSTFLTAAGITVARINAAYDCAGLKRPFIQASVLENLDASRACNQQDIPCEPWMKPGPLGTNSGVNLVPIPSAVIEVFRDEITSADDRAYYLDSTGQARTDLKFNFFRFGYQYWDNFYAPDISRLEGRLWLYHMARCYLDLGYTSLHLGQPRVWGRFAGLPAAEQPAALHRVATLVARIRLYAHSLPGQPTILLTAEPMSDSETGNRTLIKLADGRAPDGRAHLIFDFSMAAMHPRETSPELDERPGGPRGTAYDSDYRCPVIDPAAFSSTACTGQPLATIDPCHGYNFVPDGGGTTMQGYTYNSQLPYVVYFDHNNTVNRLPNGDLRRTGELEPGTDGTWGWDDSAWFSKGLSDGCQADWLAYEMKHMRTLVNSLGFLAAPGRLTNNVRAGLDLGAGRPNQPGASVPDYRLATHPAVAAAVAKAWQPAVPHPTLTAIPGAGYRQLKCTGTGAFRRHDEYLPAWKLQVENTDITSIYTWHIQGPNGPETIVIGSHQVFRPTVPGNYTVVLQQDNMGLPAGTGGRRRLAVPAGPSAVALCLSRRAARVAAKALL